MTEQQIVQVQKTWKIFRQINPELVGDVFYTRLFMEMPALKRMFKSPIAEQSQKLIVMISLVVSRLHNLEEVAEDIKELARRHVGYGVRAVHYEVVGSALLWTLEQGLGHDWNPAVRDAWTACYQSLAGIMIEASEY